MIGVDVCSVAYKCAYLEGNYLILTCRQYDTPYCLSMSSDRYVFCYIGGWNGLILGHWSGFMLSPLCMIVQFNGNQRITNVVTIYFPHENPWKY